MDKNQSKRVTPQQEYWEGMVEHWAERADYWKAQGDKRLEADCAALVDMSLEMVKRCVKTTEAV